MGKRSWYFWWIDSPAGPDSVRSRTGLRSPANCHSLLRAITGGAGYVVRIESMLTVLSAVSPYPGRHTTRPLVGRLTWGHKPAYGAQL